MELISNKIYNLYYARRERLVSQMQKEDGWWRQTGQRFEEFKPSSKSTVPTEWLISVYLIRQMALKALESVRIWKFVGASDADTGGSVQSNESRDPASTDPDQASNSGISNGELSEESIAPGRWKLFFFAVLSRLYGVRSDNQVVDV
jgi:hypothetical protein